MKDPIQIGSKVRSKGLTSPVSTGIVGGVIMGKIYKQFFVQTIDMSVWYKTNPQWEDDVVYMIHKDLPEIPLFQDEIDKLEHAGINVKKEYRTNARLELAWYPGIEIEPFDWLTDFEEQMSRE